MQLWQRVVVSLQVVPDKHSRQVHRASVLIDILNAAFDQLGGADVVQLFD
jgi:hypothetical protein